MSKAVLKGGALLAPVPAVMVSCGTLSNPNIITVAWTGIVSTHPPKTYISLRKSRYSYDIIKNSREFVINLTTKELVFACDFCGVRSGRDVDKFKENSLTAEVSASVSAPSIKESPVSIECRVTDIIELGSHDMFLADIVSVSVDEKYIDKNGRFCFERAGLCAYVHGDYFALGEKVGQFGFSVRKKKGGFKPRVGGAKPAEKEALPPKKVYSKPRGGKRPQKKKEG